MPIFVPGENLWLSKAEIERLWQATRAYRQYEDDIITVRGISEVKMAELNARYRGKNKATNVLTFSYSSTQKPGQFRSEHDVALCLIVAQREAAARGVAKKHYLAGLCVHAFLHVTGLDHERSKEAAAKFRAAEMAILRRVAL